MAAGDVEVQVVQIPFTKAEVETIIETMRVGANDKWLMTSTTSQLVIARIEEA